MFDIQELHSAMIQRRRGLPKVNPTPKDKSLEHPAPHAPRIFVDSASIEDIRPLFEAGIVNGVTTNPSLLRSAGARSWEQAKSMMRDILQLLHPFPVSLELTRTTIDEMVKQAEELRALGPDNAVIKVATGGYTALDPLADPFTGLKVLRKLWERDIRTNATLVFNTTQAFWAANAGASYVSPFMGRLADYLYKHDQPELPAGNSLYYIIDHKNVQGDQFTANSEYVAAGGTRKDAGVRLVREIAAVFLNYDIRSEVLAASVRNAAQLTEVLVAGADIVTVPANVLASIPSHPLSDEGMVKFNEDAGVFSS